MAISPFSQIPMDKKRNIAVVGHRGAGKTSLSEGMLWIAGATDRLNRVDDANSVFDYEPEEQKRQITLSTSIHHYDHDKHRVVIADTPGYTNFLPDTDSTLHVMDGAVIMLSAISGIKVQTEQVWAFADNYAIPKVAFVNKMDKEHADSTSIIAEMEEAFNVHALVTQIPIGHGDDFRGVVDLRTMTAHTYTRDGSGKDTVIEIPAELKEEALKKREEMIELIAEVDDALTEKFLEGDELSMHELADGIREGVLLGAFVPILYGSAYHNMGTNMLMDFINRYFPSPNEHSPATGTKPGAPKSDDSGESEERERTEEAPFSGFIFKTIVDPFSGKLSVMRLYSGKITLDTPLYNSTRGARERTGHFYLLEGKKLKEIKEAGAGDIIAMVKLKDAHTGDTLCDESAPILYPPVPPVNACLSYALTAKSKADEDKVPQGLTKLMEEDPTLTFERNAETGDFLLSGTGQLHIEVSVDKLKRKYGCEVVLTAPHVPYKETIRSSVKVQGRYKKQSGGRGQYGDVWLEFSPLTCGSGFEFDNAVVGGAIPRNYIPAVEKGLIEALSKGFLAGFPMVDIGCKLYDGSYHNVDSSEMAFKVAASMAYKKAMESARPVLMEPIMDMEIVVPEENMGDIMGDINSRRGKVQGMETKGKSQVIKAQVPMAEITNYANDLNGMTHDRGLFTMSHSHYEELPPHLVEGVIAKVKAERG